MNKFALAAFAGLAASSGAYADAVFHFAGPVAVGAGDVVTLFSGHLSGDATGFAFSFFFGQSTPFDPSWASDMQIKITAANGNSVTIGGYSSAVDIFPAYDGPFSEEEGVYGDTVDLTAFDLAGDGIWTVTIIDDYPMDGFDNIISSFDGTLLGSVAPMGGVAVPIPSALSLGFFGLTGLAAARRRR